MMKETNMRNWVAAFAALMVLTVAGGAVAQSAQTAKVILVDVGEISRSSLAGKDLTRQGETLNAELQAGQARLEQEFRAEEQELIRQRALLSPEAFEEKSRAVGQKIAAARNDLEDKARRYQIGLQRANATIQSALTPIYQELMKKHGANLILDRRLTVMPGPGLDVTREVIDSLDASLPSLKVEIPPVGSTPAE